MLREELMGEGGSLRVRKVLLAVLLPVLVCGCSERRNDPNQSDARTTPGRDVAYQIDTPDCRSLHELDSRRSPTQEIAPSHDVITDGLASPETANSADSGQCDEACPAPPSCLLEHAPAPCDDGNTADWDGCTNSKISEFQVNEQYMGNQQIPKVADLGNGGFVVAWYTLFDDVGCRAWLRVFDAGGVPQGPDLPICPADGFPRKVEGLVGLPDGRALVLMTGSAKVVARILDSDGVLLGPEFDVVGPVPGTVRNASLAVAPDGGFLVTWEAMPPCEWNYVNPPDTCPGLDGSGSAVLARHFNSDANPSSPPLVVNSNMWGSQMRPTAAQFAGKGFLMTWESSVWFGIDFGIKARFVQPGGAFVPASDEYAVSIHEQGVHERATAVSIDNDTAIIVWQSCHCYHDYDFVEGWATCVWTSPEAGQDGDRCGIFGRLVGQEGPIGPETQVNSCWEGNQVRPAVAALGAGTVLVAWGGAGVKDYPASVYGRMFDDNLVPLSEQMRLSGDGDARPSKPALAAVGDSRFVVVWESCPWSGDPELGQDGDGCGIFGQVFTIDGEKLWKSCNDSTCDAEESCATCPTDCGPCPDE